jgi:hypothetical protein
MSIFKLFFGNRLPATTPQLPGKSVKIHNGSAWIQKPLKYFNGSGWVEKRFHL